MAQAGYTPIQLYYSTTPSNVPSAGNLLDGELAINIADKKLYAKDSLGNVFTLADPSASGTVTSVDVSGGTTGLTTSGGPVTTTGTITIAGTLVAANGGTGQSSYAAGDLLYATGSTALSKLAVGTSTQILTSSGTAPQWTTPSSITVGTATNIAGGSAGAIAYNSGSGTTTFLSLGTTNFVLTAGASAPQYVAQSTLSVGTATNLASGAAGSVPYQTGAGTTTFLSIGAANTVLTSSGSAPQWTSFLSPAQGGTGVANNVASTITISGAFGLTLTLSNTTSVTLPTTGTLATLTGTETLTNKRINPRTSTASSTASLTPDISSFDQYNLTAQAATLTVNAPTGTPVDGNRLTFRILDNGVSQTINWNGTFTAIGVTLPAATTAGKMTYVGCVYNSTNTRWDVVAVTTQA